LVFKKNEGKDEKMSRRGLAKLKSTELSVEHTVENIFVGWEEVKEMINKII
jgi:hypothetical protein